MHEPKRHNVGRPAILTEDIKEKLDAFLCRNDISFTLPGCNKQVYTGKNEQGESLFQPKNFQKNFQPSIFTQDPKKNTLYKVKYQK